MFTKIKKYFREVITELKQTSWPSKNDTKNMTLLVFLVATLLALYLGGLDFLLQKIMGILI
ncbi:MAG: Preprotein translocase SecE subunit [Candidatus Pacebacteria bacterium GW2011_GWF2_38_9]|nr:MAG: preprotein translocase subunit SecE, preprotein translocase subunit SecE [candidate division TM6 bacterium GW2011_GWF2_28_16]KKQ07295.1 MAG: Preprotein translocase SecE subunit [Candidatus Pacebacteria bacterium GW2011_GWF1_36_5]KKQ89183.1 MAG: Preprotein translocase SecE subunit [Candidatus Pacebacteria bacterium GW2011_GWF2_38_9]MBU1034136.1 preprotein translocase subunit SecE [Patescibacteria group bacterium]HAZ73755.1 preprotein translocase subunit SecE [Candidatus Paceibacterota ba